jgi:RNA polymerase sigma-70 factor (ECF subfamily)
MHAVDERRLTDADLGTLVEDAMTGDLDAFEQIVRRLQGPVRSFARRMLDDPHLGDDAAQEVFVRVWRGLRTYRPEGRFVAWTFTIARNTCVEFLRKQRRTEELTDAPDDPWDAVDVRRAVRDAVGSLAEPFRTTLLLRETGLPYEDIAHALDCPLGTVRSRLHEARRMLQERLAPFIDGGGS